MKKPYHNKSEGMKKALKGLFPEAAKNIEEGKCATCGSTKVKHEDFRDDPSRKEYGVSGMCQECQDSVWGKPSPMW